MTFKPMLAPQEDPQSCAKFFDYLSYPLLASHKLDGIRGVPIEGTVRSRTLKALRSRQVQKKYGMHSWLDGEMIIGEPTDPNQINLCQSHIMSFDKPHPDLRFYVFDCANTLFKDMPFHERLHITKQLVEDLFRSDYKSHFNANSNLEELKQKLHQLWVDNPEHFS